MKSSPRELADPAVPEPSEISSDGFAHLACEELKAAGIMFDNHLYQQAFYHTGLNVELALKCRIMRHLRLNTWPDRKSRPDLYVHNLSSLADRAGLRFLLLDALSENHDIALAWLVAKDWNITMRYDPKPFPKVRAADMLAAARDRGLVQWLLSQ